MRLLCGVMLIKNIGYTSCYATTSIFHKGLYKTMPDNSSKTLLTFNGHQYYFDIITTQAGAGPKIAVKLDELDLETEITISPEPDEAELRNVVFFKYNGKFVVLAGRAKVSEKLAKGEQVVRGSLISTPVLKRSRLPTEAELAAAAEAELAQRTAMRQAFDRPYQRQDSNQRPRSNWNRPYSNSYQR